MPQPPEQKLLLKPVATPKRPAGHGVQLLFVAPSKTPYVPAAQPPSQLGDEAPPTENLPTGHNVHDVAPLNEYFPAPHAPVHADWPVAVLNRPAAHAVHAAAPEGTALNVPTAHAVHTAALMAPVTVPYVPAPHAVQRDAPLSALYAPAAHTEHEAALPAE